MGKIIEFACTHNNGRSPLAKAFADQYLILKGLNGIYQIISSGTRAEQIEAFLGGQDTRSELDLREMAALGHGRIYMRSQSNELDKLLVKDQLNDAELKIIRGFALIANHYFVHQENNHRAEAFKRFNLPTPAIFNQQTKARPDVSLFLGMEPSNVSDARKIYSGQPIQPKFETLKGFVTGEVGAKFRSAYAEPLEAYMAMADTIKDLTYKAMEKTLNDPSLK